MANPEILDLIPFDEGRPQVGLLAAALTNSRQRTLGVVEGLALEEIEWLPEWAVNSVGSLLYHIPLIEADWLYSEILEAPIPQETHRLFPWDVRDEAGRLTVITGVSVDEHLARMATVREELDRALADMDDGGLRRLRSLPDYHVSPAFVLHHLMQHEAQHRGEIVLLRRAFRS